MMMIPQQGSNLSSIAPWLTDSIWQDFVNTVLDLTIESYEKMFSSSTGTWYNWDEAAFSVNLHHHLDKTRRARGLWWNVGFEIHVIKPQMLSGELPVSEAKRYDICISDSAPHRGDYFVFECKLVSDKYGTRDRNLPKAYVNQGMARFIVGEEYSVDLPESGMIGYVLAGSPVDIVDQINDQVAEVLSPEDCLQASSSIREFQALYHSEHIRHQSKVGLRLHHLFLTFDFSLASVSTPPTPSAQPKKRKTGIGSRAATRKTKSR